jgi:hypothetical protein
LHVILHNTHLTNLSKETTRDSEICYNKNPKPEIEDQERETSIEKWQQLWDNITKGTTKEFFPQN